MISGTWKAWDDQPGSTATWDGGNQPTFQPAVAEKQHQDFVVVAWGILGPVPVPNPQPPEGRYISAERPAGAWPSPWSGGEPQDTWPRRTLGRIKGAPGESGSPGPRLNLTRKEEKRREHGRRLDQDAKGHPG